MPSKLHIGNFPDNFPRHILWFVVHYVYRIYIWIPPFLSYMLVYSFLSILYMYICARLHACVVFVLFSLILSIRVLFCCPQYTTFTMSVEANKLGFSLYVDTKAEVTIWKNPFALRNRKESKEVANIYIYISSRIKEHL